MGMSNDTPDVKVLVADEARILFHHWLSDRTASEIDSYINQISDRAADMTFRNYLWTFPLIWPFTVLPVLLLALVLATFSLPWVAMAVCILSLVPWLFILRTYHSLGAVCKRRGSWRRGAILVKKTLPEARRRSLAIHEVYHGAIALGILPTPGRSAKYGEEALATALETVRRFELEGEIVMQNTPAVVGVEIAKAVDEGRIPETHQEVLIDAIARKAAAMELESLPHAKGFLKRLEAFNEAVGYWQRIRSGQIEIEEFLRHMLNSKGVHLFGHKVGWAKAHGLMTPEFEKEISTMLVVADPTEQEANSFVDGLVAIQCGMWVGHLEKSGRVRTEVASFVSQLVSISLLTPFQAYDLARRTIEGEYNEKDILKHIQSIIGATPE